MRPASTRRPQGQSPRPAAPPLSPPPATSIPIPFYPSSLRPPISQQSQNPPPNPALTAPPPPPPPAPTRPRQHQATRAHVKVQQRFALPAELRAVLQCMPPPKKPRLVAPIRRSASGDEDRGGDRKRRRPPSPSISHLPVSKPPCAAVPQDVGHLENAMTRISLSLQEIQQELRSQQHYPHPAAAPAPPLTLNDTGTAATYRVISTATVAPPSLLKERVMKCRTNSSSSSSNQNYNKSSSSKGGGPRFTIRNAGGTELVLDGGVEGRMVEILVGDFTGGCRTSQEEEKVRRPSIPSPLPKVVTCAATTQDACTSPSVSLLTQGSDEMCESEESSVASVVSSVWFQHRGALQQRASPLFSSCSSLELPPQRPSSDEVDDDNDDVHSFSVAAPTDLSLTSLPLEWPVPAPSPLPSQSSHCFLSRESCFSPLVSERQHVEERREDVSTHEEKQEEKEESISGTSVRTNSRCSSCCDCSSSVVAVASEGEGEEKEGYNSDSSRSSSCSSYSSSSSSSSSSFCSSSSSTISISSCCHTVRERNTAFTTTPTLPVRLLRW